MLADKYRYPKFICEQPPYNLLDRRIENEFIPMCQAYDLGIIAWSPLAHGVLAGRYTDADNLPEGSRGTLRKAFHERITQAGIDVGIRFAQKSNQKKCSAAQLAVAWVLHQPGITGTIIGPRNLEQLEGLLPALGITLDDDDTTFFDSLVPPGGYVVNYFNTSGWMK
jgi:aryl-alcohol dehydrogenase-like predicted oxidoreductase